MMTYRVAAYITSYEDPEALQRCVAAIRAQTYPVAEILVVENSLINHAAKLGGDILVVEHHPENIGISGGLRIAITWAVEKGFDFLWTFDQDSEASKDALEILLHFHEKLTNLQHKIGILAPTVQDHETNQKLPGIIYNKCHFLEIEHRLISNKFYECDAVITSGSLVSLEAAKKAELPNKDLFIDAVDWDYCIKLKKAGFSVFVIRDAILKHRYGRSNLVKRFFKEKPITISNYSALRHFYINRNHTYVELQISKSSLFLLCTIFHRFRCLCIFIMKIIFFEKNDVTNKIWACLLGFYCGLMSDFKKEWKNNK